MRRKYLSYIVISPRLDSNLGFPTWSGWSCKRWEVSERYGVQPCLKPVYPFVSLSQPEPAGHGNPLQWQHGRTYPSIAQKSAPQCPYTAYTPHFSFENHKKLWNCPHFDLKTLGRGYFRCEERVLCSKGRATYWRSSTDPGFD